MNDYASRDKRAARILRWGNGSERSKQRVESIARGKSTQFAQRMNDVQQAWVEAGREL